MSGLLNIGIDLGGHTISCSGIPRTTVFENNVNVINTNNGNYIRQYKSGSTSYLRVYYKGAVRATLYSYNGSTAAVSNPVLLPDDFGVINSVDESATSYQYLERDAHVNIYAFSEDLDKVVINNGSSFKPDVLYTGDSNGDISLSANLANYKYLRIFYRDDDNAHRSITMYDPVGKYVELTSLRLYTNFSYIKSRLVLVGNTKLSTAAGSFGNLQLYPSIRFNASNIIYITRVEAWN